MPCWLAPWHAENPQDGCTRDTQRSQLGQAQSVPWPPHPVCPCFPLPESLYPLLTVSSSLTPIPTSAWLMAPFLSWALAFFPFHT